MDGQPPKVLVEKTSKKWKSIELVGGALAMIGVFILVGAFQTDGVHAFGLMQGGGAMLLVGFGVFAYARFGAWWHHG